MYNGVKDITLTQEQMAAFYKGELPIDILQNEYLFIRDDEQNIVDKFKFCYGKFEKLKYRKIDSGFNGVIKPLNDYQECLFDLLDNDEITVKAVLGTWGSGKTFVSLCWALGAIEKGKYRKLVYIRNNVEVKDSNPIGHLPADQNSKLKPWAMPIADIMGGELLLDEFIQREQIELSHLGFIRGRTFDDCILLVSECQNLTREHIEILITRCGKGTVIIFDGDNRQVDKSTFEKNSGLEILTETLKGNELFGAIQLKQNVRSKTAALADLFVG